MEDATHAFIVYVLFCVEENQFCVISFSLL